MQHGLMMHKLETDKIVAVDIWCSRSIILTGATQMYIEVQWEYNNFQSHSTLVCFAAQKPALDHTSSYGLSRSWPKVWKVKPHVSGDGNAERALVVCCRAAFFCVCVSMCTKSSLYARAHALQVISVLSTICSFWISGVFRTVCCVYGTAPGQA